MKTVEIIAVEVGIMTTFVLAFLGVQLYHIIQDCKNREEHRAKRRTIREAHRNGRSNNASTDPTFPA